MSKLDVAKAIGTGLGNLVVKPIVTGVAIRLGVELVDDVLEVKKKRKIQKGLKEGTIKEIGGLYYEVDKSKKPEEA